MEHSLIANTRFVKSVTASGIKRLLRNTMALQQCMKILTPDDSSTEFERAKRYYNLFYLTPAVRVPKHQFIPWFDGSCRKC